MIILKHPNLLRLTVHPVSRNPTISVSADDGSSVWSDVASPPPTR